MDRVKKSGPLLIAAAVLGVIAWLQYQPKSLVPVMHPVAVQTQAFAASVPTRDHVIDLPEDGQKWYTVLIYSDKSRMSAEDHRLAAMVASNPRIQGIVGQTKVLVWDNHNALFDASYRQYVGDARPCLVIQRHDGQVCSKTSGPNIPATSNQLADKIESDLSDCKPKPAPQPTPQPTPAPIPDTHPQPAPPKDSEGLNKLLAILLTGVSAMGGAYSQFKKGS